MIKDKKWTRGRVEISSSIFIASHGGKVIANCMPIGIEELSVPLEEAEANAELIKDAFNVANETNLSPRELLAQRDELIEVLKELYPQCRSWKRQDSNTLGYRWAINIERVLSKSKEGKEG